MNSDIAAAQSKYLHALFSWSVSFVLPAALTALSVGPDTSTHPKLTIFATRVWKLDSEGIRLGKMLPYKLRAFISRCNRGT